MAEFHRYAEVYAALYRDKEYEQEALYLSKLLGLFGRPDTRKIIEFGAGSGELAAELGRLGFAVVPTDLSPAMAQMAKPGIEVSVEDIRDFSSNEVFDGAIAFFHVLSYLTSESDLDRAFSAVASALKPGGVFLADFWYGPAVEVDGPSVRVKRAEKDSLSITRIAEPNWNKRERTIHVHYTVFVEDNSKQTITRFNETHSLRYFTDRELKDIAARNGFDAVRFEETLSGNLPSPNSWGVTGVFRRH